MAGIRGRLKVFVPGLGKMGGGDYVGWLSVKGGEVRKEGRKEAGRVVILCWLLVREERRKNVGKVLSYEDIVFGLAHQSGAELNDEKEIYEEKSQKKVCKKKIKKLKN